MVIKFHGLIVIVSFCIVMQEEKFSKGRSWCRLFPFYISGKQIWERVSHLPNPIYDKFGKHIRVFLNLVLLIIGRKKLNLTRYNLDIMHINEKERRLYGMKSQDFHIFMQILLSIGFWDMFPKSVWEAISELSVFFTGLCSTDCTRIRLSSWKIILWRLFANLRRSFLQYLWLYGAPTCSLGLRS